MPRGGRIGPPHVTRSRSAFNALDMFKKLIQASTGPTNGVLLNDGTSFVLLNDGTSFLIKNNP